MLRSLVSLLIIASFSVAPISDISTKVFPFKDLENLLYVSNIPQFVGPSLRPAIQARAALVMDVDSGTLLFKKNANLSLPMASLTKIMTAILILESHNLSEVVTIADNYSYTDGVKIWLRQYDRMTVGDLLIALLVPSAGDAALALADFHSGSYEAFIDEMNEKAKSLNLKNTKFKNPIGLDEEGHYSSVFDLSILTKYALRFKSFRRIIQMPEATITSTNGTYTRTFDNTNHLLDSYLNVVGVKTGTTDAAGLSVINLAKNNKGSEIITVLLNSPDRFQESKSMIDWTFRSYHW